MDFVILFTLFCFVFIAVISVKNIMFLFRMKYNQ